MRSFKRRLKMSQLLSVVSHALVQVVCFLSGYDDVVVHTAELSVACQRSLECFGFVGDELHVQFSFAVEFYDFLLQ
jgi:hypothetical protein